MFVLFDKENNLSYCLKLFYTFIYWELIFVLRTIYIGFYFHALIYRLLVFSFNFACEMNKQWVTTSQTCVQNGNVVCHLVSTNRRKRQAWTAKHYFRFPNDNECFMVHAKRKEAHNIFLSGGFCKTFTLS